MVHGYNTGEKKQEPVMNNQDQMNSMEENIVNRINFLKDEIINLKEIVIRNLQDENENLRRWCERLEKWCSKYESDHNALTQYGRRNNATLSGIPQFVSEDASEESMISVLADSQHIQGCHRFGKSDRDKSQKTVVRFCEQKKLQESFI